MTDNVFSIGDHRTHPDDTYPVGVLDVELKTMMQFCPLHWKIDGLQIDAKNKGTSQFFVTFNGVPKHERPIAFEWVKNMLVLFFEGYNFLSVIDDDDPAFYDEAQWEDGRYLPEVHIDAATARRIMSEVEK
jgi:hypothetical protein